MEEREARRRKITSRGTDRMALITGRIHTIDPNISKSCSFSNPSHDPLPTPQHSRSSSEPAAELFHDHHHDSHYFSVSVTGLEGEDNNNDPKEVSKAQSLLVSTTVSNTSENAKFPEKPFEYNLSPITPKEISFSIVSSEDTRVICSLAIAILVVLSHINLPHNVVKSKSLIAYRPLYAVLITDVLIVAARLALYSQGKEDEEEVKLKGDGQNWGEAFKFLEWGLVIHQTLRAIFIDCSFYLVIVVCGLSLV